MTETSQQARFEMRGEIGSGGAGTVYRVLDRERGEEVALKTLRNLSGREIYRFKREFRSLIGFAHPNLVRLYELFSVGDDWMFTMELVDGVPFHKAIRPDVAGPIDQGRLRSVLIQLLDGLAALHAVGAVHRDLKPSNVLVQPDGRVVILDFGLVADTRRGSIERTHEQAAVGTPGYMAPEQAADLTLTSATDCYALGVMLYELITGHRPFEGTATAVLLDKQTKDAPPLGESARHVPPMVVAMCESMLAREPEARPTVLEMLDMLDAEPSPWTRRMIAHRAELSRSERAAELATMHQALADSRDHTVVLLMVGAASSGKTCLLDRFADDLKASDTVVMRTRSDRREALRYRGFDTLIDEIAAYLMSLDRRDVAALLPPDVAYLSRMFPSFRRVPGADLPLLPGSADGEEVTRRGLTAVRDVLRNLAQRQPLAVLADDVQWGSMAGAQAFLEAITGSDAPHMLVVLAWRPDEESQPRLEMLRSWTGDLRVLELAPWPAARP